MSNRYLEKVAEILSQDTKKELANTATIGLVGGGLGMATHSMLSHPRLKGLSTLGKFGLSTGVGLLGDYAAVKANNQINKHL